MYANYLGERSSVYTSAALAECVISEPGSDPTDDAVRRLVFFHTNIGHAGEWIDELLRARAPDLARPVLMINALSSNHVTESDHDKAFGADVSDVVTWILATNTECDAKAFDYLQYLQRNLLAVRAMPEKWMPWNYPVGK